LKRIAREAKESGDWPLVVRALETLSQLNGFNPKPSAEIGAVKAFISGENQYAAGQFSLAVVSYENALRDGGGVVPVEKIAARLKDIQTNHVQEYKEGLERFRTPMAQSEAPAPFFIIEKDSRRGPKASPSPASEESPKLPEPKMSPTP
jgi:hypothetical protein